MPTNYLKLSANKLMRFMNHSQRLTNGEVGYNIDNLGIRYGLAATATQSNLIENGLESFRDRLKAIASNTADKKNHDLPAFFDTIALYSGTTRYQEILGKEQYWLSLPQRLEKAKTIIKPVEAKDKESDQPIVKFTDCYDKQTLKKYLTNIPELTSSNDNISFVLTNHNHAITLGYNTTKKTWCVIDANQLKYSLKDFDPNNKKDLDKLTKIILNAFDPIPKMLKNSKFNPFRKKTIGFTTEIHSNSKEISNKFKIINQPLLKSKDLNNSIYQLYLAVLNNDLESAENLLKNNIISNNINKLNAKQLITEAILNNNTEMLKILLTPKIKDNIQKHSESILNLAVKQNNTDILTLLLKNGMDPNAPSQNSLALYEAVKQQNIEMIKILLEYKANPNTRHNNESVLYHAVSQENKKIVELLTERRADTNNGYKTSKNMDVSPLYMAIRKNNPEIIKLLLQQGANPNIVCDLTTPLNYAIEHNYLELIKIILENSNTDPNGRINNMEKSPLYVAVENYNIEAVELLLQKGANIYSGYNKAQSALDLAKVNQKFFAGINQEKADNAAKIINLLTTKNHDLLTPKNPLRFTQPKAPPPLPIQEKRSNRNP